MKKIIKILTMMFALLLVSTFVFACNNENTPDGPEHTHNFSGEYKSNDVYHWLECECGEIQQSQHYYDNGRCVCGKEYSGSVGGGTQTHTHSYDLLKYDSEKHWYECECGLKTGENKHSGAIKCGEKAKCSLCLQEFGEIKEHNYTNPRLSSRPTVSTGGQFLVDCTACGEVIKKDLPALIDDSIYSVDASKINEDYHVANYIYEFNGVSYIIAENVTVEHLKTVDGYTEEKYPMLKSMVGFNVSCQDYSKMAYDCKACAMTFLVNVRAAHAYDPSSSAYKKELKDANDCLKGGVESFKCKYCEEDIRIDVPYFEHDWQIVNVTEKTGQTNGYELSLYCSVCKQNVVREGDTYIAPTCLKDGFVKYKDVEYKLPATGNHVVSGITGYVRSGQTFSYPEVYKVIKELAGTKIICGKEMVAGVDCQTCDDFVLVNVIREHNIIWSSIIKEASCLTDGEKIYHCGYRNCEYFAEISDYGKKNFGSEIIKGEHSWEFSDKVLNVNSSSQKTGTFNVWCTTQGCSRSSKIKVSFNLVESRQYTCIDYLYGKVNTNKYVFMLDDTNDNINNPTEMSVTEKVANHRHMLKGKYVEVDSKIFVVGDDGVKQVSGIFDDCKSQGQGGFICELCEELVLVKLVGKCKEPSNVSSILQKDGEGYYWVCQDCNKKHYVQVN